MLIDALPDLAYRDNLQTAELMAAVMNMMGGKPDPNDGKSKPIPRERMFTGEELLVWFAQRPRESVFDAATARLALEHRDRLPDWARSFLPWAEIEALTA